MCTCMFTVPHSRYGRHLRQWRWKFSNSPLGSKETCQHFNLMSSPPQCWSEDWSIQSYMYMYISKICFFCYMTASQHSPSSHNYSSNWKLNQKIATVLTFALSSTTTGFTSVVLSTIERRYRFSSTSAGLIASTFDMAVLVSVLFISYFGGKGHKPRWLGISLIIQGLGEWVVVTIRALIWSVKHAMGSVPHVGWVVLDLLCPQAPPNFSVTRCMQNWKAGSGLETRLVLDGCWKLKS